MPKGTPANYIGFRKGHFLVIERLGPDDRGNIVWRAQCDCGREFRLPSSAISGSQLSCGCRRSRMRRPRVASMPEYTAWSAMKQRCYYPKATSYPNYGGRGVSVADEWRNDFKAFLAHVGPKPSPAHTLDRIDSNRNYEPGNVRWATRKEQGRNVRDNHLVEHNGRTMPISAWAEEIGCCHGTLFSRLTKYGWSAERALTTPVNRGSRNYGYHPNGRRFLVRAEAPK